MKTAELLQDNQGQSIRLPKGFRFSGTQLFIKKIDNVVMLIPYQESWQSLFDSLEQFSDDFMENREQPEQQFREGIF